MSTLTIVASNIVVESASESHEIGLYTNVAVASLAHGYRAGFVFSTVLALISLFLTLRVTEPRMLVARPLPPGP